MVQILPMVVSEQDIGISFKEYAPFFTDFDDDNEDPLTFSIKVEKSGLPKFSNKEFFF